MISLVCIVSLTITTAVAFEPDCSKTRYPNGIGFVQGPQCQLYYMCIISNVLDGYNTDDLSHDDLYTWYPFCCAEGLSWDEEHLTCKRNPHCNDTRDNCPNATTTTNTPCPHRADPNDETKFITSTDDQMSCPYSQVWNQTYCTCIFTGEYKAPCTKVLNYTFTGSYDSYECNNFAAGVPYGKPYLDGNMLCLDGKDTFLYIPFLNNWFGWNPIGKTFTLCFWLKAKAGQSAGVFSTNADNNTVTFIEIWLDNGELVGNLTGTEVRTGKFPSADFWGKVCIVFNKGHFLFYYNASPCGEATMPSAMPVNSHKAATVGFVYGKPVLNGYFDDICFWTVDLSEEEIKECFDDGPSNEGPFGEPTAV